MTRKHFVALAAWAKLWSLGKPECIDLFATLEVFNNRADYTKFMEACGHG